MIEVCGRKIKIRGRLIRTAEMDGDKYLFLEDPHAMIEGLREAGTRIDLFTFLQRPPQTSPKFTFPMEWDNLAVLPVSTFDHWWSKQVDAKTRNMVRKAEKKDVALREVRFNEALVRGIWKIYNECPMRQGFRFHHYGKDIDTVHREAATYLGNSIFIGAFLGDDLIGFVKLTGDATRKHAGLMHIIAMIKHRDKAPTNALISQAVRSCADRGISQLIYSNFAYGNKQSDSLSEFKRHNGFERVNIPRYYVPLTHAGSAAFRLGLHHTLNDLLPEPVLARLRDLRSSWYNRRLRSAADSSSLTQTS
jgi:hypothetical protein